VSPRLPALPPTETTYELKFGSGKVTLEQVLAPAIELAEK